MKKSLLSLAAVILSAIVALAGTPVQFTVSYDVETINDTDGLSSLVLSVTSTLSSGTTLTLDASKKVKIVTYEGYTVESSSLVWDKTSLLTVNFNPAVTTPGTYSVFLPEGLFVANGVSKISSSWQIPNALTIEAPEPGLPIDIIDIKTINDSRPAGDKLELNDPNDFERTGKSGTMTGNGTGTSYDYKGVVISDVDQEDFTFATWNGYILNTTADAGYIQAVKGVSFAYFSNTPIDPELYYNADYRYVNDPELPVTPNGPAKYVFIPGNQQIQIKDLQIEWGEEPVVGSVAEPDVYLNTNEPANGSVVTATASNGATVWIHAVSSTGVDETVSGEGSASYTLAGESGTEWTISVWATQAGCNDSPVVTNTYTIITPKLMAPVFNYPSEDNGEHMPVNGIVTISNWNYRGTIYYKVNHGETLSSEEMNLNIRAVGEIGDPYEVEAWIEAPGYETSDVATMGAYLVDNKLPVPTIAPNGGAVLEGQTINITANDNTMFIVYRINGGEWINQEYWSWMPVAVTINESCLLEAYASAGDPEEASFIDSDIVLANFTVEKLAENEVIYNKETFEVGMMPTVYQASNAYGDYEYYGFTWTDKLGFSDAYYGEEYVEENNWFRNITANDQIKAVKANMAKGALAVYLGDEVIEPAVELWNNETADYLVAGSKVAEPESGVCGDNGEWIDLSGTKFAGKKFIFIRGYQEGVENEVQSLLIRYGKTDSVQNVEDVNESVARYFTLDGVEVDGSRLAPGLYVRVAGTTAEKVIVR